MAKLPLTYAGEIQPEPGTFYEPINRKIYPYYPDDDLKEAVNLSLDLDMPLLLEGEPGCGKSRLAHALVYELNKKRRKTEQEIQYQFWTVQSISTAQDSLYTYDYVGRLQAAQLQNVNRQIIGENPTEPNDWVDYQPLGKAFKKSQDEQIRSVVLIDEIDKADRDFPNDLLLAIEDKAFRIKEIDREIKAHDDAPPIIIITSNQEKRLPDAFLRRCLYYYIEFPGENQLKTILSNRFTQQPEDLIDKAIDRFLQIRYAQDSDKAEGEKKVSTSELIAWFQSLIKAKPEIILEKLEQSKLPNASVLLKSSSDRKEYGG